MKFQEYLNESHQTVAEYKEFVITDNGKQLKITDTKTGKEKGLLPRYGVWGVVKGVMELVVDVGDDLNLLKKKYKTNKVIKVSGEL